MGYADNKTYKSRDAALKGCLTDSKCQGVTMEANSKYRLNSGFIPIPENGMTAYIKGGAIVSIQKFTMTYAGYSWTFKQPFTLSGYTDKAKYKTRNAALSACAATDKCLGVTKEGAKKFRLNSKATVSPQNGRAVWIQGGKVIKAGGYTWALYKKKTLSGYVNDKVYKTRDSALNACSKAPGCKGVTKEGDSNYRMNSSETQKNSKKAVAYVKSSKLIIEQDYYWTKVSGLAYTKNYSNKKYTTLAAALAVCAKDDKCTGVTKKSAKVFICGKGTDLTSSSGSTIYIQGSRFTMEYFVTHGGNYTTQ